MSSNDKTMGILAYLGPLVLVPIFAAKDSAYARFHANQGLVLWICWAAVLIIDTLLGWVPVLGWILSVLVWILSIVVTVFCIIGIVNAAKGEMKPLPVIGGIKILK